MRKQLHILEHPILHGKPADDFPVHVIWEPEEYASWNTDVDGTLRIFRGTGVFVQGGQGLMEARDVVYVLRPGGYLKAWEEDLPDPEPQESSAFDHTDQLGTSDLVFERAQPGHDGYSEDPLVITGEQVLVVRADDEIKPGYTEPDDQKTQVIQAPIDKSKRPEYLIDTQSGTQVPVMRTEAKKLDWGTLTQPLVVPEKITFFEDDDSVKE